MAPRILNLATRWR